MGGIGLRRGARSPSSETLASYGSSSRVRLSGGRPSTARKLRSRMGGYGADVVVGIGGSNRPSGGSRGLDCLTRNRSVEAESPYT